MSTFFANRIHVFATRTSRVVDFETDSIERQILVENIEILDKKIDEYNRQLRKIARVVLALASFLDVFVDSFVRIANTLDKMLTIMQTKISDFI